MDTRRKHRRLVIAFKRALNMEGEIAQSIVDEDAGRLKRHASGY
jgi:hypothetical protein